MNKRDYDEVWRLAHSAQINANKRKRRQEPATKAKEYLAAKNWREAHKAKVKASNHAWYLANRTYAIAVSMRRHIEKPEDSRAYTVRKAQRKLAAMEEEAGRKKPRKCEICANFKSKIHFDHCHKTLKFRAWLCHNCNVTLGLVKDNSITLRKLADLVDKHSPKKVKKGPSK